MIKVVPGVRMDRILSRIFLCPIVQTLSRSTFSADQMAATPGRALIAIGFPTVPVVWKMARFQIRTTVRYG